MCTQSQGMTVSRQIDVISLLWQLRICDCDGVQTASRHVGCCLKHQQSARAIVVALPSSLPSSPCGLYDQDMLELCCTCLAPSCQTITRSQYKQALEYGYLYDATLQLACVTFTRLLSTSLLYHKMSTVNMWRRLPVTHVNFLFIVKILT